MKPSRQQKLESLARKMLCVLDKLGDDPMARIDARVWHRHFKRKLDKLDLLNK